MPEYERHIEDEQMYRDAVRNLRKGEQFKYNDLMNRTDVNFDEEQFTPYDYAYMVNALKEQYDISERPEQYMKMAREHLRNESYPERGGERAYYDYARRSRRNYNRYDDSMRFDGYDNRRSYNERNSYRDRDNDGRYNE
jgi:hypothetical protein